jgi:cytochrome c oxidase cbb3-type subunit 4
MEIGLVRGVITVTLLVLFIGLWVYSWSKKRKNEYEAASQLPLEDDSRPPTDNTEMEHHS